MRNKQLLNRIITVGTTLLFFWGTTVSAAGQGPVPDLNSIGGENALTGICVIEAESGHVVTSYRANDLLTPASVQKLITASTLLLCRPADSRLITRLQYEGSLSAQGGLCGDIVIRGCGDPSLGSQYGGCPPATFIEKAVEAVQAAGIRTLSGRVIADDRVIFDSPLSSKWLWEDIGNYYAAGCYGLNFSDNRISISFRTGLPGSRPQLLDIAPKVEGLRIYNHLSTNRSGIDSAYIYGAPYEYSRRLYGSLPASRKRIIVKSDMPDPPAYLAYRLTQALRQAGISVTQEGTTARLLEEEGTPLPPYDPTMPRLLDFASPTLLDLWRHTLLESDNLYAESLLCQIGLTADSVTTLSASLEQLKKIWRDNGLPIDEASLYDGSGLSPMNRISPLMLGRLLVYAANHETVGKYLIDLLPHPGEGTLRLFMADSPYASSLHLKSGSMSGVQCYAGYYTGKRTYVIVVMVNHFTEPRRQVQQEIADTLNRLLDQLNQE
ncbi:MAG: D-alanyl-D-alanine carboxypeptidase/D-alanyl-D-alanine-endopeptidase [Porphyromonadaceae bacterium]|nr:D-alanyl-D-alanine carboxypeptidase/D-alanyl-D-alanine-endopeptidase [Porphyromonadaceae bacterium]